MILRINGETMSRPVKTLVKYNKDEGLILLKDELLKQIKELLPDHPVFNLYNEGSVSTKETATTLLKSLKGK
jgi:hypothetical protein